MIATLDRVQIVSAARSYLGVPHVHQGRNRECGLDCVGLLLAVAQDVGARWHDLDGYSRSGAKTADGMGYSLLREHMAQSLEERPIEEAEPGDVLLFWIERTLVPHHVGILVDGGHFVHAAAGTSKRRPGSVKDVRFGPRWASKLDSVWRFVPDG